MLILIDVFRRKAVQEVFWTTAAAFMLTFGTEVPTKKYGTALLTHHSASDQLHNNDKDEAHPFPKFLRKE